MRRRILAIFVFVALSFTAAPASAQGDLTCPSFSSDQAAAQAYFEAGGGSATSNYQGMDADGNGIACDEPGAFEGGGPSAGPSGPSAGPDGPSAHPTECAEFDTQSAAQTFLDGATSAGYNDVDQLDTNGNGIACDEPKAAGWPRAEGSTASVDTMNETVTTALPSTGSGPLESATSSNMGSTASVALLLLAAVVMIMRRTAVGRM